MLTPAECEIRTITIPWYEGTNRETAFCHGPFCTVKDASEHWRIFQLGTLRVILGAFFHSVDDACAAMGDLASLAISEDMEPEMIIRVFNVLRCHDTCLTLMESDILRQLGEIDDQAPATRH